MGTRRVLVFGASGFIGAAVANALDGDPHVDSLIRAGVRVRDAAPGSWIRHDLVSGSTQELTELLRSVRPDAVVDCVGRLSGTDDELVAANTLVIARLIEAVAAAVPEARLVTLGSAAEYGVVPVGTPVPEDHPTNPVSAYGITKQAATQLVRRAAETGKADAVALRVFNPIGARSPAESLLGRAASAMSAAMERGTERIRLGPLGSYRDFVDVRDVASAVRAVLLADAPGGAVFNVGSGQAVTCREAVERLAKVAGFTGRIEESQPAPGRSAAVDWIAADVSHIHHAVGWQPAHHLGSSLEAVWEG
jgi:nucleoside-diphosphate-sugar epimerase